jgi:hypothetical protein
VKALCCDSTGAIALIGRSHRQARVRKASHFRGEKVHRNDTDWQEDCGARRL